MSDSLEKWLPKDLGDFTRVFDPVIIDEKATFKLPSTLVFYPKRDLQPYHPKDSIAKPFNFRLVRIVGTATATVEILDGNWDVSFAKVLALLRLRVVNEGQCDEHLLDDEVTGSDAFSMSDWKVVSWTIKRTGYDGHFDTPELSKLTDRIVWQRLDDPGVTAVSSYTWLPYKK